MTKIENCDWNQDFSTILTDIKMFGKFWQKSKFSKILAKIEIYRKYWLENFYKNQGFWISSKFAWNGDFSDFVTGNWDFSMIFPKIEIFRKFWLKSTFFENVDKAPCFSIQITFSSYWGSPSFFKLETKIEIFKNFDSFRKYWLKSSFFEMFRKLK